MTAFELLQKLVKLLRLYWKNRDKSSIHYQNKKGAITDTLLLNYLIVY
ncbi:hypothetical protein CLV42_106315 [Chitinophaga ginsengisoli]|uniref:Uncharacterized protein n=1 Tax=Chitinophaga ginsengisoli TaxID=363837 RepID=A0A2P8G7N2_9BACT|nr:hypothetical protein CLV42_106315 [Chitinophaga ginsengisoli]